MTRGRRWGGVAGAVLFVACSRAAAPAAIGPEPQVHTIPSAPAPTTSAGLAHNEQRVAPSVPVALALGEYTASMSNPMARVMVRTDDIITLAAPENGVSHAKIVVHPSFGMGVSRTLLATAMAEGAATNFVLEREELGGDAGAPPSDLRAGDKVFSVVGDGADRKLRFDGALRASYRPFDQLGVGTKNSDVPAPVTLPLLTKSEMEAEFAQWKDAAKGPSPKGGRAAGKSPSPSGAAK